MANEVYIDSKTILMFMKRESDEERKMVACTSEDGFNGTRDSVDVSNKCTVGAKVSRPGDLSWTFTSSGQAIDESLSTSQVSFQTLMNVFQSGEIVEMTFANMDGSYFRQGEAWISSYTETANTSDAILSFQVTFQGVGNVITEPTT